MCGMEYYELELPKKLQKLRDDVVAIRHAQLRAQVRKVRACNSTPQSVATVLGVGVAAVLRVWE